MANIDRVVNIAISLKTAGVTAVTFSDLLLFGEYTAEDGSLVNIITSADELVTDYSVTTNDPIYQAATAWFSQIPHPPRLFIGKDQNTEGDVTSDIIALTEENNDWYGFCDVSHDPDRAVDIATWCEANEKLNVTVLVGDDITSAPATDTTSTAALLKKGNFFRTAWWYGESLTDFIDVAIASKKFTQYPGQETWANATLAGVDSTFLTETKAQNIFGKNGNTFEPFRSINITQNGKTAGGEWIDVIRFRDWLAEEVKVRIFNQLVDNRIPYTDPGIAIIRSRLQQALDTGVTRGGIAPPEVDVSGNLMPSYTISVPLAAAIDPSVKATRILYDVEFTARLAGAIHVVYVKGVLTYENLPVNTNISGITAAA